MAALSGLLAFLSVLIGAVADDVSPVEKVITMLKDLQTQVIMEGKLESKTYDTFACFCKDASEEKNQAINDGQDAKGTLEGNIGTLSSARDELDSDIAGLNKKIQELTKAIADAKAKRAKDLAEYDVEEAEIDHANNCVKGALDMLNQQKKAFNSAGASFAQVDSLRSLLREAVKVGAKLGLSPLKRGAITKLLEAKDPIALLQGLSSTPEDAEFASGEIIEVVDGLKDDFGDTLVDIRDTEETAKQDHEKSMERMSSELSTAESDLASKQASRADKVEKIGVQSKDLTLTAATLADDQAYLMELTSKCNLKAAQWEQRSQMRTEEITALTTAIHIVEGRVKDKTSEKTVRLVQLPRGMATDSPSEMSSEDEVDEILATEDSPAFLQLRETPRERSKRQLSAISAKAYHFLGLPSQEELNGKRALALNLLRTRGAELQSSVLLKLTASAASDPFGKLRQLIQELVERLLQEAADEANAKGWCDKEIGKAKQTRKLKAEMVHRLNSALGTAEATRDKLTDEIATLRQEISELQDSLAKQTKERDDEKTENEATISEAEEGKTAVDEAIQVLERFYKTAAKAEEPTAELLVKEQSIKLSRGVDDDMPDAGFDGANKGSQSASKGILGMLEVIQSDFIRTIEETTKEEKNSEDQFLAFSTATKVSIGKKTAGKENRESELEETKSQITEDNENLVDEQNLLDKAIQELIELQPQCVETGMSYEERVAKREQEIDSLKEALCVLDTEGPVQTESGCDKK